MFLKRYLNYNRIVKPLLFIILALIAWFLVVNQSKLRQTNPEHRLDTTITIKGIELKTMIVDTPEGRSLGLSDHTILHKDEAMLFIFNRVGVYPFWMKDMDFPIDIFWLNENKEIVFIKEHAEPSDYPKSYNPRTGARYVVETVDGFAHENEIEIGNSISW